MHANLHPKFIFGFNTQTSGSNFYFVDNHTILYPAGNTIVLYSVEQKIQQFLHGVEKGNGVTSFCVSHNRVHAAVAQPGEKPTISIFDIKANRRKKVLSNAECGAREFISLAFTSDGLHLVSLTNGPEYNVLVWKWEKGRMMCFAKTTGSAGPVYEISTSPLENNAILATGKNSFRFLRFNEGNLKQFGFQKGEVYHIYCQAFIGKGDRVIAGTSDGKLLFFERGEFRHEILIKNVKNEINGLLLERLKSQELDGPESMGEPLATSSGKIVPLMTRLREVSPYFGNEVTAVTGYSKGFIAAYGTGNVIIFEENLAYEVAEDHYRQLQVLSIPAATTEAEDRIVKCLKLSPNEETLIATTYNGQVVVFALSSIGLKTEKELVFDFSSGSFHFGSIVSMDICIRKSLVATAGIDKFIRIWNYTTMSLEVAKEFTEDINSISLHPTGLFLIAGCNDKVRLYTIILDDIRESREFPIQGCKEITYSHGGQLFALVNGNLVQLYNANTLDLIHNYKGHSGKVKKLIFSPDDGHLISCGLDGAIYEWDVGSGKRSADFVDRNCKVISIALTPDSKSYYALTEGKTIREIQISESIVTREVDLIEIPSRITMSSSGKILLIGLNNGCVRSMKQPLLNTGDWIDYQLHLGAITDISVTIDEMYCVTTGEDSSLIFWKITDSEGRAPKGEKETVYSTEVLVTKADLEERQLQMDELKQRLNELRLEMDYQLKRKDMGFNENLKMLTEGHKKDVENLTEKIDELNTAREGDEDTFKEYLKQMSKGQEEMLEGLEAHYNSKLIGEFEKYNSLQLLLENTIKEYDNRLGDIENDRGNAVEDLVGYFEGKIKDKNQALEQAFDNARDQMKECEELANQIEEDADTEILELTASYERKLNREKDLNGKLKGESGIMRKKFLTMQKDIDEQKNEVARLANEGLKMKTVVQMTEKEISTLKKDLVDRDAVIRDRERVIYDLKKTNNELEKFKFVLDYKIKELRKMIEPKEREIIYLKQQNQEIEGELEVTINTKNGFDLQVNELKNKLRMMDAEMQKQKFHLFRVNVRIHRILSQLSLAMANIMDHNKLKNIIKHTNMKYGYVVDVGRAGNMEQETICELVRQNNHLELSLYSVKKQMNKDVEFTRNEQMKIMQENMLLVYEINNLRKELKNSRDRITLYEKSLGVSFNNSDESAEMRLKLAMAVQDRDEIDFNHEQIIENKEDMIEAQGFEIEDLATKLTRIQEIIHDARPDTAPATTGYKRESSGTKS